MWNFSWHNSYTTERRKSLHWMEEAELKKWPGGGVGRGRVGGLCSVKKYEGIYPSTEPHDPLQPGKYSTFLPPLPAVFMIDLPACRHRRTNPTKPVLGRIWPVAGKKSWPPAVPREFLLAYSLVTFYEDDMLPFVLRLSDIQYCLHLCYVPVTSIPATDVICRP